MRWDDEVKHEVKSSANAKSHHISLDLTGLHERKLLLCFSYDAQKLVLSQAVYIVYTYPFILPHFPEMPRAAGLGHPALANEIPGGKGCLNV